MNDMDTFLNGLRRETSESSICDAMIYVCFESDYPGHNAVQEGSREAVHKAVGSVHDTPNWLSD
jgi:hypothetical protein